MIVNIKASDLATGTCECGEPAAPGLFSVQYPNGDPDTNTFARMMLEPLQLCEPCGDMAQAEHGYGVIVFRVIG